MSCRISKLWIWLFFFVVIFSRFWLLENKPIHFDEGINGWFVLQMQKMGLYIYDPKNFHGPLYFYLLEVWTNWWGPSVAMLRSLPAVFSLAMIFLFWRVSRWAALLLLLSPMFVFYGRSGIHETVFVFFQMVFFIGLWDFRKSQKNLDLYLSLLGLWGMLCLKETFIITLLCATLGFLVSSYPWKKFFRSASTLGGPILFFGFAWAMLYSGFGRHWSGLEDFFVAFVPWMKTGAQGSGHEKSFFYWLELMALTEPLLLGGVLAAVWGILRPWRALGVFALLQLFFYSWIPYKTPWCVITLAWPLYFCLGLALENLWNYRKKKLRWLVVLFLLGGFLYQGKQLWLAVYQIPIDLNHPLVYVNSTYEFKEINQKIMRELNQIPSRREEIIQISLQESWPLPWTLQKSQGLRYDQLRKNFFPGAWIYFCDASDDALLQSRLGESAGNYRHTSLIMRQNAAAISVWWRED